MDDRANGRFFLGCESLGGTWLEGNTGKGFRRRETFMDKNLTSIGPTKPSALKRNDFRHFQVITTRWMDNDVAINYVVE